MQRRTKQSGPVQFASAEAAWFCAVQALQPGRVGIAESTGDVVKCLDTLYRHRRIDILHARILRIWGVRGVAPNPNRARERSDWLVWREAMDRLDTALRARGIVVGPMLPNPENYADSSRTTDLCMASPSGVIA